MQLLPEKYQINAFSNIFIFHLEKKIQLVRKPIAQLIRATSTTPSTSSAAAAASSTEVAYQRPIRGVEAAPVRYGFIPEEWYISFDKNRNNFKIKWPVKSA